MADNSNNVVSSFGNIWQQICWSSQNKNVIQKGSNQNKYVHIPKRLIILGHVYQMARVFRCLGLREYGVNQIWNLHQRPWKASRWFSQLNQNIILGHHRLQIYGTYMAILRWIHVKFRHSEKATICSKNLPVCFVFS